MSLTKISQLTSAAALSSSDSLYVVQSGQSRKTDLSAVRTHSGIFNVLSFGAYPNGTTDSTSAIQSAVTAAAGRTLFFPPGNYRCSTINITSPITIIGENSTVNSGTTHTTIFSITSSNVYIRGLNFIGAGNTTYVNAGRLISIDGVDGGPSVAPTRISNVTIERCNFSLAGRTAIFASFVSSLSIIGNTINNMGYSGTEVRSSEFVHFAENRVTNISPGTGTNLNNYGVYFSQVNSADTVRYPSCKNVQCTNNYFENIEWEGIDCHSIESFLVQGNTLKNCGTRNASIAIIYADNESQQAIAGCVNVRIIGNTVINGALGIALANTNNSIIHENITIVGNTVQDVGNPSSALGTTGNVRYKCAIRLASVVNATVHGNIIKRAAPFGVVLDDNKCDGVSITGNSFSQMYSNTVTTPAAVYIQRDGGTGSVDVSGNTLTSVTGLGTYSNGAGVWVATTDGGNVNIGRNNFKSADTPYLGLLALYQSSPVVSNHGQQSFSTTTSVNTLSVDITLPNVFSSNTTYVPTADIYQMTNGIQPCVVEIQRLSTSQVQLRLKTCNGANFAIVGTVSVYWQAIGF